MSDEIEELRRQLAQKTAELDAANQKLQEAQQVAVLAERNRLARDLHDAVTQTLFSVSLIAEVLPRLWERSPDEGRRRLEELRQLSRGAVAEMRTLLLELRPTSLAETKMSELLRQLSEAISGKARLPIEIQAQGSDPIPGDVKVAFYRIAQEAVNNVARHAGASQATVTLNAKSHGVEMCIRDNGRGFDPATITPEHLGLGIMRERAGSIGADLKIASEIGKGTQISVYWKQE